MHFQHNLKVSPPSKHARLPAYPITSHYVSQDFGPRFFYLGFGLPNAIRTDNGAPFASPNSLFNLSRMSVWWLRLGIAIERSQPGCPQDNGRHERMHLTLKKETTKPAGQNLSRPSRCWISAAWSHSRHHKLRKNLHRKNENQSKSGLCRTNGWNKRNWWRCLAGYFYGLWTMNLLVAGSNRRQNLQMVPIHKNSWSGSWTTSARLTLCGTYYFCSRFMVAAFNWICAISFQNFACIRLQFAAFRSRLLVIKFKFENSLSIRLFHKIYR